MIMRTVFALLLCVFASYGAFAQEQEKEYDPMKEYEMKTYYFGFLKSGPNRTQSEEETQKLQKEHLNHLKKMADDGKLAIAGPFLDNSEFRGVLIFNTETQEEAEKLANSDPAVKAGRLIVEIKPWMAAKGTCLP